MKKLLLILLCVPLIGFGQGNSVVGEKRVLVDELTEKGNEEYHLMYYERDLFNGVGYDVYENGQLQMEYNYKDGIIDGETKRWWEDGKLRHKANFKDGNLDGEEKWYEKNGQLRHKVNYKDGKRDGLRQRWHQNGQLVVEEDYKDGELISGKYWDREGNEIKKQKNTSVK